MSDYVTPREYLPLRVRIRLWLSYQRYALMLTSFALACPLVTYVAFPALWAAWTSAALVGVFCLSGAIKIGWKFGHKLRVTAMLERRYKRNGFNAEQLRQYAEDPCYRVVSNEVMRRVDVPAAERRRILKQFKEEAGVPVMFRPNPETGALERVHSGD